MKWFVSACLILSLTACTVFMETRQPPYTAHGFSSRSSGEVQVLWIGHSTVLLRLYDKWVLTDPNFSTRVGLVVKRFYYPGADLDSLPSMDAVLISHTHMDHLDRPSLSRLKIKGRVAVPAGAAMYLPSDVERLATEFSPWDTLSVDGLRITAVPANHFGGRYVVDNFLDGHPYTGYVLEYRDITIYFAGDTGYDDSTFVRIGKQFHIDLALIPIGPTSSISAEGFGNPVHVNARGALRIFKDLQASYMVPIHYGTFYRPMDMELRRLADAMRDSGVENGILVPKIGQPVSAGIRLSKLVITSDGTYSDGLGPHR
ncbi:MAG: MBL fold metallo-hydrolase [Bacteroidetes bacterium]|nr:MBL fold metallo-hydrolase [Bacteroidota bacterium]